MATQINHDSIYIGGVFNGPPVSERDPSRRARIPSFLNLYPVNVSFSVIYQKFQLTQSSLYYKDGIYTRKSSRMNTLIEQKWYAHRKYRNLIVHQIELLNQEKADICMLQKLGNPSRDFRFSSNSNVNFVSWFGSTLESEGKDVPLVNVSIIMTNVNQTRPGGDNVFCKTLIRGKPFTFLAVLVTSLESSDPHRRSIDFFTQYSRMDPKELLSEHIKEWRTLKGNIHVEGDKELNNNIQTSLYYILSSIRSDWEYSLSPGSISTNTYNGHIFWDTEFWMYPILLNFYPEIAKSILNYRISRISRAEEKAKELGYKGAMFPWESAFSGIEVTPTFAETRDLEIHISGDIVVAIDDYLQINRAEKDELLKYHELSSKVADFYVSRSTKRIRQPQGFYDINLIVPPDEYAINVNNSVFTNAVAQVSMEIASKLSTRLGLPVNPLWKEVSSKLFIPFNESNQIHLEYEGYAGQKIKQADVVLLGYPLQWKPILSNPTIRKNDLYYYEPLTDQINGPAMSWGMYSIGHLELKEMDKANSLFRRSYNNTHAPFYVWSEIPRGGGTNFITGAGGFLQNVVNGFGGMRIRDEKIFWDPELIKGVRQLAFEFLHIRGSYYSVTISSTKVYIFSNIGSIKVTTQTHSQVLDQGKGIEINKEKFTISK